MQNNIMLKMFENFIMELLFIAQIEIFESQRR